MSGSEENQDAKEEVFGRILKTGCAILEDAWHGGITMADVTMSKLQSGKLGGRNQILYGGLGAALDLLIRMATCQWECKGGDHDVECLLRRVCNAALGALDLGRLGYYDEGIALVRGVGEISNLLILFYTDSVHLGRWKTMPEKERKDKYGPPVVRRLIQTANKPLGIDEMNYKALCSFGVHVTPESLRTPHHDDGKGYIGPTFSVTGFTLLLNELAINLAPVGFFAGCILNVPNDKLHALASICKVLHYAASDQLRASNYADVVRALQEGRLPEGKSGDP